VTEYDVILFINSADVNDCGGGIV